MTRPQWRVLHEDEEPPQGRSARDLGDGRRAWLDDLECMDDGADGCADADIAAAEADAAATAEAAATTPGNGADTGPTAGASADAATLREAAARLAGLDEDERALQRRPEAKRLGVRVGDLDAAIKRAQAAAEAAQAEQQAKAEGADSDFSTEDKPVETIDDIIQQLAGKDGLAYVAALGDAAKKFKVSRAALEQLVQRKRERPLPTPTPGIVLPRCFRLDETGLWFQPLPSNSRPEPWPIFVCGPFKVLGEARDHESRAWAVAIEWFDRDRRLHIWSCPQRLVHLEGNAIAAELADAGLTCGTSKEAHELLKQFFGSLRASHRLQSAERAGWHTTSAYSGIVMPDGTVITPEKKP